MIDRQLLETAAKAAEINGAWAAPGELPNDANGWGLVTFMGHGRVKFWNPLTDDGDAFRLAVKLDMIVDVCDVLGKVLAQAGKSMESIQELTEPDVYAATRRAIVRAAAAYQGERA